MKKISAFFTLLLMTSTCLASSESWTVKSPMPMPRTYIGAVAIDSMIYVFAGYNKDSFVHTTYAYNTHTDKWSTRAPIPFSTGVPVVGLVDGKVYVMGGFDGGAVSSVGEYDPVTDTWALKTSMPLGRGVPTGAAVDGKIYITGGWPGEYTQLDIYNPRTDKWTTGADAPMGRQQDNGGAAFDHKFYFIGGANYGHTRYYADVDIYDPITDKWTAGPPMPQPRYACPVTVLKNRLYVLGGVNGSQYFPAFTNNDYFDLSTGRWHRALALLQKRSHGAAVTVENKIYLIGGLDNDGNATSDVHQYTDSALSTGIQEANPVTQGALSVYPNPSKSVFMVQITTPSPVTADISIIDMYGKLIAIKKIETGQPVTVTLDAPAGTYFISAKTAYANYNTKITLVK